MIPIVRRRSSWSIVVALLVMGSVCAAAPAAGWAQSTCDDSATAAFDSALRARRVVDDYQQLRAITEVDLGLLREADEFGGYEEDAFRAYLGPVADARIVGTGDVCTNQGGIDSSFGDFLFGGFAGLDYQPADIRLQYYFVKHDLDLGLSDYDGDRQPALIDHGGLVSEESSHFLRLQLTNWFALIAGRIRSEPTRGTLTPGLELATAFGGEESAAELRYYLGVAIPELQATLDLLVAEEDASLEEGRLGVDAIPIPAVPLAVGGSVRFLEWEEQVVSNVRVALIDATTTDYPAPPELESSAASRGTTTYELSLDTGLEYAPFGLRSLALRGALGWGGYGGGAGSAAALHGAYLDSGVFAEATAFDSHFFEEQANRGTAFGVNGGFFFGIGTRIMSVHADILAGVNRPRTLELIPAAAGYGEIRAQVNWRIGW